MSYYFVGTRYYINGVETPDNEYADVYPNDEIKVKGKVYRNGSPAPGIKVELVTFKCVGGTLATTYTDSSGYFEMTVKAPDWSQCYLCNERSRQLFFVLAWYGPGSLDFIKWMISGTARCRIGNPRIDKTYT